MSAPAPTSALGPEAAAALGGPDWLVARRTAAAERAAALGLPSVDEEIWRYSPIGDLDLDAWSPPVPHPRTAPEPPPAALLALLEGIGQRAATVMMRNGHIVLADVEPRWADAGLLVDRLAAAPAGADLLGSVAPAPIDVFGHLNDAFAV